ncbi:hypothetical protein EYF80_019298 [Liparis tanakae]|uniref:Uncharacterized protein n=1 Tax=Liparis tanakae TaxID=230148 RepID=A0A4Z2HXX5_9TELE|nr:hypothetical protein EYF80_019298 [Liparis tanakae]
MQQKCSAAAFITNVAVFYASGYEVGDKEVVRCVGPDPQLSPCIPARDTEGHSAHGLSEHLTPSNICFSGRLQSRMQSVFPLQAVLFDTPPHR